MKEEIQCLNIEIHRVVTKIKAEDKYLQRAVSDLTDHNPLLAHQIEKYCLERARFDTIHMQHFHALARHPSCSGNLKPGDVVYNLQRTELGLSTIDNSIDVDDAKHNGNHSDEEDKDEEEEEIMEIQKQQEIESIMLAFTD